jgi:hypothetical protein
MECVMPRSEDPKLGLNCRNNTINGGADLGDKSSQKGCEVGTVTANWPRRIALAMPESNNHEEIEPIKFHTGSRTVEGICRDLFAVFDFPMFGDKTHFGAGRKVWPSEANIPLNHCRESQPEQLVLVYILQISKNREQRRELWVRSIVWLQTLDGCPHWVANPRQTAYGFIRETSGLVANGESELVLIRGRVLRRLVNSDRKDKVVNGASEIVDGISNDKRPSLERWFTTDVRNEAISGKVSICLASDEIRATVFPPSNLIFDGLSMFVGTPELSENTA